MTVKLKKKDITRENLLIVAHDVFKCLGYKRATMDDISTAAGKGKSSLYYYFPSKELLFLEVIRREAELLRAELSKVILKDITPEEKLKDYIFTKITTSRQLADFFTTIKSDATATGFIDNLKQEYDGEEIRMIRGILLEGARKGRFAIKDFTLASIGITTAIKGLEMPLSIGNYSTYKLSDSVDSILDIICNGIRRKEFNN